MNQLQQHVEEKANQWIAASRLNISSLASLSDFVHILKFFRGATWLFRGEDKLYDSPASPSIFRGNRTFTRVAYPDRSITDQEIDQVEICQSNHPGGSDRYIRAFLPSIHRFDVNWLQLAQHFRHQTRLLDVTINPLVALYFACQGANEDDGYVYVMNSGSFRPVNDRNPPQSNRSDFPPIPVNYLDLYDVDKDLVDTDLDDLPYLLEPTIPQERLLAQGGKLLFWRNSALELPRQTSLEPIRISSNAKLELLSHLTAFGITQDFLFPN